LGTLNRSEKRRFVALGVTLLALVGANSAHAQCRAPGQFSACFDADPIWPSASASRLVLVSPATVTATGRVLLGVAATHGTRLVTLEVPAPDPAGRELSIVRRVSTLTLVSAVGLGAGSEATLSIPWTATQQGLGLDGIRSQTGEALPQHPLRDPRLGFASELWRYRAVAEATLGTRYTLVLPIGNEQALAGERGIVGAPALTMELQIGRFFAGVETGARLRQPTQLANARLGTQLVTAAGIGLEVVAEDRLTLSAEAFLAPTLVEQPEAGSALAPAEWMISASATPLGSKGPSLVLGGGGGLPLSTNPDSSLVGMTSPALRIVAIVRQPLALARDGPSK